MFAAPATAAVGCVMDGSVRAVDARTSLRSVTNAFESIVSDGDALSQLSGTVESAVEEVRCCVRAHACDAV